MANEFLTSNEDLVGERYRLGKVISRSARTTVCETELDPDDLAGIVAVIKVCERNAEDGENSEDSEDRIRQWQSAMELAHPNLLKIYAAGSSVLNDVPVTYAVMERADESLEGVLGTRPLTGEEAREMLVSATMALRYLHENGYTHSRLRPSNVLAVGEQVKLSSDSVTRMEDGGSAEDMRSLGALIVRALTQQLPDGDGDSKVDVPAEIPQPFREVAQHCLDPDPAMRWTAVQVLARLTAPEARQPLQAHQPYVETIPVVEPRADLRDEENTPDKYKSTNGMPRWVYAVLAALVLIVFLMAELRSRDPVKDATIPAGASTQTLPAEVSRPAPFQVETPVPRAGSTPTAARAGGHKSDGWSVIVAAYASRELAEKRMRDTARRWPSFHPTVYQPQTAKTHYIVVLGRNLSEDQAEALRRKAVAAGLPRDTYIKRVM